MAAVETTSGISVKVQLNNGAVDGKVRTVNVSLGSLDVTGYGADGNDKAMNIVNLLGQCVAKPVYRVQKTTQSTLTNE